MNVLLPWFLAVGAQTWRDVKQEHRPPLPSELLASSALFAALAVLGQANERVAGVLAWGFLVALVVRAGGPQSLVGSSPTQGGSPGGKKK